jgi:cytochrome c peroxidase
MILFLFVSCDDKNHDLFSIDERNALHHMQWQPLALDETNQFSGDSQAISFGEELFYEEGLSPEGIACSNCHDPDLGFSDGLSVSIGVSETSRHSPSLWFSGYQRWYTWDGSCDTLWCQATGPIEKSNEMGSTRTRVSHFISDSPDLIAQYESLFGDFPNVSSWPIDASPNIENEEHNSAWLSMSVEEQEAATQVLVNVTKSIAAFEESLVLNSAPIDDFILLFMDNEQNAAQSLTDQERNGMRLFIEEGECHLCHSGPLGTNFEFHNIALPSSDWVDQSDLGRYNGIDNLIYSEFNSSSPHSDAPTGIKASRLSHLLQTTEQLGQFKVPTLRQLVDTAPYMHGGHFETLEEVVTHYSDMNDPALQGHTEDFLQPRNWSKEEIEDVISFLMMFSIENQTD